MSLHLVFSAEGLASCLQSRVVEEPIVLLGDGVYASSQNLNCCFVLQHDANARGVAPSSDSSAHIDYAAILELTIAHHPSVSWTN
ncbi:MAG: hypothetical protein GWP50_04475 [Proteobacteria bacterium]|nr:hypothetical protein [Pseudomonadota bacterium]